MPCEGCMNGETLSNGDDNKLNGVHHSRSCVNNTRKEYCHRFKKTCIGETEDNQRVDAENQPEPEPMILTDFNNNDKRAIFKERVSQYVRNRPMKASFYTFASKSVEIFLTKGSATGIVNVDELKKELGVSSDIELKFSTLTGICQIQWTTDSYVIPGDDIFIVRGTDRISMKVTMAFTNKKTGVDEGKRYLTTIGHDLLEGDVLYCKHGDEYVPFADVKHCVASWTDAAVGNRLGRTVDIAVAELRDGFKSLSNVVDDIGRQLRLSNEPACSWDAWFHRWQVQKFCKLTDRQSEQRATISGWFSQDIQHGPLSGLGDCLTVVCDDDSMAYQELGESGTLLIKAVDDGSGVREVCGVAVLIARMPIPVGDRVRWISMAVPFDQQLSYLASLQIFTSIDMQDSSHDSSTSNIDVADLEGMVLALSGRCIQLEDRLREKDSDLQRLTEQLTLKEQQLRRSADVEVNSRCIVQALPEVQHDKRETRKHLKQLIYKRIQIRQDQPPKGESNRLKKLVYSRQQIQNNETLQTVAVEQPVYRRGLGLLHGHHLASILSLPYELHEMLLKRSSCLLAKTLLKTDTRPDIQLFNTLSSVCRYFHFILTVRRRSSVRTFTRQQLTVVCHPCGLRPMLLGTIVGQREAIWSLCTLNNKLYVNYSMSTTINVYTSHDPYTLLPPIQTPFGRITDISSCNINDCVYVAGIDTEGRHGVVNRVTTAGKLVQWLQKIGLVRSLSVTSDGEVVLLFYRQLRQPSADNRIWHGGVEVYNSAGLKLTRFDLSHDLISPWRAVQTADKHFIISHGNEMSEHHRVCKVNNEGSVVKSYGGLSGCGFGQLDLPTHFAVDSELERIIVADSNNQRALLLDKQLNIQRVLLTWSLDDYRPRGLFYEKSERRLFVGFDTGEIQIYRI